jgi:hypothetical protein
MTQSEHVSAKQFIRSEVRSVSVVLTPTFPVADRRASVRPLCACPNLLAGHAPSADAEYRADSRSRVARFLKAMDLDFLNRVAPCGEIKQIRIRRKRK